MEVRGKVVIVTVGALGISRALCRRFARERILPHPEVKTYMQRKTADYDRWLRGMRGLQARFIEEVPLKKQA
jgi:hypothetical protein